jgi:hypothetical protein
MFKNDSFCGLGIKLMKYALLCTLFLLVEGAAEDKNARRPQADSELRQWLENMVWHHRFSNEEITAGTGLNETEIRQYLERWDIRPENRPSRGRNAPLLILPYPGGRHPRIGFLDGAVDPQRETKLSIFTPWDENSYVVADVPEAIWSNLGLTYLAHTHVPTIWSKAKIDLPKLEWQKLGDGRYKMERTLPNGIRFGTLAHASPAAVAMKMWLSNGTAVALSDLRVQNCVMLKGAAGFSQQTNTNKVMRGPFAACRSETGNRWIITGWQPIHRTWANEPVPCLHADPKFPDTNPGETSVIYGLVTFYTGPDIEKEFQRIAVHWYEMMTF